jgi:methionine synthase I (cobalamin-dependent)
MMHAKPFCIGLNCALGAKAMKPFLASLSECSTIAVHAYPNAGLPNAMGMLILIESSVCVCEYVCVSVSM